MLHITNGDSAAEIIRRIGIEGAVLPWRDVLHEGPVPAGLTLEGLSEVRSRFLVEAGYATSLEDTLRDFRERDGTLKAGLAEDEIVLWFEADLYDQLQLIQILDWIGQQQRPPLSIICIGEFAGIDDFVGLGQLTVAQMAGLFPARRAVSQEQIALATRAWQSFTAPDPGQLNRLVFTETAPLAFLRQAVLRLLAEYPLWTTGLGSTERGVLQALHSGPMHFDRLFRAVQGMEERPFMGDTTLWARILQLAGDPSPVVTIGGSELQLTSFGLDCLQGKADFIGANGIDRWMGGVHLTVDAQWRWDPRARQVGKVPT